MLRHRDTSRPYRRNSSGQNFDGVVDLIEEPREGRQSGLVPVETLKPGSSGLTEAGLGDGRRWEAEVEHVGGRRLIRGEILVMTAGLIFVAAALLKPWSIGQAGNGARPTPTGRSGLAVQPAASGLQLSAAARQTPALPAASPGSWGHGLSVVAWDAVDWSALAQPDTHSGWGVSTATVTEYTRGPGGSRSPAPRTSWTSSVFDAESQTLTATVAVSPGRRIFAIAVTWPGDVAASRIGFIYQASGWPIPGMGGVGAFPAMTELPSLPATQVATTGGFVPPSLPGVQSGQFWIAPVDQSTSGSGSSPAQAWRMQPWSWPVGEYKVTVESKSGVQTLVIRLVQRSS